MKTISEVRFMTNEELREFNKDRKFCQIGFVCNDIKKTMDNYIEYLNIGPWLVLDFENKYLDNFKVNGKVIEKPYKFIVALANAGNIQFELVQQVYGEVEYQDYIERRGEGLQHIKEEMTLDDIKNKIEFFKSKDIDIAQTGWFGDVDLHCIFDTEPVLNFIYEVGNNPEFDLPPDMYYIYPRE